MDNKIFKQRLLKKAITSGCFVLLTIGAVIGISIANNYIKPYEGFITNFLCSVDSGGETNSLGDKLAVEIEQEGAILAQNVDNVLPLEKTNKKVNVFGHSVVDWLISNSGSGSAGPGSSQKSIGLLDALELYGVEYNTDIIDYYKSWCAPRDLPFSIQSGYDNLYRLADPSLTNDADYLTKYNASKTFSDTAIVCLSRAAGEHIDPPHEQINNYKSKKTKNPDRGYLEITEEEEDLLKNVGRDFDKVIVIINSSNVMQMDFMKKIPGLDACLIVGPTGTVGAKALPKILYGEINPSGRTADTWPMNHKYNPTYYTSGYWPSTKGPYYTGAPSDANLKSMNSSGDGTPNNNFADYIEGIYVGYKWFETADAEGFWDEAPYNGYDNVVAYPFGHGLSYTTFDWDILDTISNKSISSAKQDFTLNVKVTNTGDVPGRDVVEVYLTAPYTPGEIEKASVKLVGFQKTRELLPGDSETVAITVHVSDFMSFDSYDANDNGHRGWELDEGYYELKLMTSAHLMKEENSKVTLRLSETLDVDEDTTTDQPSKPWFSQGEDLVEEISCDGKTINEPVNYITREEFAPLPTELNPNRAWNNGLNVSKGKAGAKAPNAYSAERRDAWDNATGVDAFGNDIPEDTPTFGANNDIKVLDENGMLTDTGRAIAEDYDSDEWDDVLDQVTWAESVAIVSNSSSYNRPGIKTVGLRNGSNSDYKDAEGASQVGVDLDNKTRRLTAYPTPTVQAQCWNTDMPYLFGLSEAKDMAIGGIDALYGPASNIHRSPYGGRNSEYHSEDGFLAGCTLAAVTSGLSDGGKTGFIKHFAVNDTEYHRVGLYTWISEQALREVFLRPFEEAVKRGEATAVMTSFNRVGATWAGGSEALIQGVLRNEWGFKGQIITDMIESNNLMDVNMHFRAGCNYVLGGSGWGTGIGGTPAQATSTPRLQNRMRENAKQVIYAQLRVLYRNELYNSDENARVVVSSSSTKSPWVWWKPALSCLEGLVLVACIYGIIAPLLFSDAELRDEVKRRLKEGKKA